ncbi:hypothetical protein AB0L34_10805 [Micromonospora sp. NPDC052213]|uniref:hypothetical protein n=1 Tax=Micromonospora sp. NPDC052213 TaxID=3155812 RepID=UPI00343176DF
MSTRLPAMPRPNVIVASTRPGRVGRRPGDGFTEVAVRHGAFGEVRLVELGHPCHDEPHHPSEGRHLHRRTREWSETGDAARAPLRVSA